MTAGTGSYGLYARGAYSGRSQWFKDVCEEAVRKQVECCENFQGFFLTHSVSGGTGSAAGPILNDLAETYGNKVSNTTMSLLPMTNQLHHSDSVIAPYNTILGIHSLLEDQSLKSCMVFDNQSIYSRLTKDSKIEKPNLSHANESIAQVFS